MTCGEFADFLSTYLEGELSTDEQSSFDTHLAVCPDCVRYLDSFRATIRIAKQALGKPDDPLPDEVPPELLRAILAARRGS